MQIIADVIMRPLSAAVNAGLVCVGVYHLAPATLRTPLVWPCALGGTALVAYIVYRVCRACRQLRIVESSWRGELTDYQCYILLLRGISPEEIGERKPKKQN
jgi:hypothetical protein